MRIDPDHATKVASVIDGDGSIKIDIAFTSAAFERLNLWERGLLHQVLSKAATTRRLTPEQRLLLALFAPIGGTDA